MSVRHSTNGDLEPAAGYYRMSSDRQETSIEDQRTAVKAYALEHGYRLVREYLDEGISGDETQRRHGFQQMIRDAARREFSAILCWDQDRFGRFDPIEGGYWIKPLRDVGVRLETVASRRVDWDSFQGRILYTIQQEAKHAFLVDLSRNSLRGQLSGALRGDWQGGTIPYAYRVADRPGRPEGARKWPKMLVPGDPYKVEVVRWIFRTYGESAVVSLRWLRNELHRRGVLSPTGRAWWAPNSLRGLLRRREYVGDYDWGEQHHGGYHGLEGRQVRESSGKRILNSKGLRPKRSRLTPEDFVIVENNHEALIDRALWEKVQAKLARNAKYTTPYTGGGDWVLSGLLVCAHCGSNMVGHTNRAYSRKSGKVYRRYRCNGYHTYGTRRCHPHNVDEAAMLDCLVRKLQDDFLNPDNLEALRAELRRQAEANRGPDRLKALRDQIEDLGRKIDAGTVRLLELPSDLVPDCAARVQAWKRERQQLETQLAAVQSGAAQGEMQELLDEAEKCLWQLREALAAADVPLLRAVLRELVVKVECWWTCRPSRLRQRCDFQRGLIHLRTDLRINRLVSAASAALWL